eukprot:g55357.t1
MVTYGVAVRICKQSADFVEGVRAILLDKDKKPKWVQVITQRAIQDSLSPFLPAEQASELNVIKQQTMLRWLQIISTGPSAHSPPFPATAGITAVGISTVSRL